MIILPLPPSINHAYRRHTLKGGRRINVLTREAEMWRTQAAIQVGGWARKRKPPPDPLGTDQWVIGLRIFWPDKRRRDADNIMKLTMDAVSEGLGVDDARFLPQVWSMSTYRKEPRIEIAIFPAEEIVVCRVEERFSTRIGVNMPWKFTCEDCGLIYSPPENADELQLRKCGNCYPDPASKK